MKTELTAIADRAEALVEFAMQQNRPRRPIVRVALRKAKTGGAQARRAGRSRAGSPARCDRSERPGRESRSPGAERQERSGPLCSRPDCQRCPSAWATNRWLHRRGRLPAGLPKRRPASSDHDASTPLVAAPHIITVPQRAKVLLLHCTMRPQADWLVAAHRAAINDLNRSRSSASALPPPASPCLPSIRGRPRPRSRRS